MLQSGCNRRVEAGRASNAERVEKIRAVLASGAKAEGEGQAAASPTATGWATIRGTFKLVGTPPTPAKLTADKDTETCGKHPLIDESVIVGSDGSLANAVDILRTKVTPNPDLVSAAAPEVVWTTRIADLEPHHWRWDGQTLIVKNSDDVGHNSNIDAKVNPSINALIPSNNSTAQVMNKEEPQPVKVG